MRRYRGKCLLKPQKEKVLNFLAELRAWLNKHKHASADHVIQHFNPILRGWSNNYRHAVSKSVFAFVSQQIWKMLWHWCLRRHPNKGKQWVAEKYFTLHGRVRWRFHSKRANDTIYLFDVQSVRIERYIKVKGAASPDGPILQDYWRKRHEQRTTHRWRVKVTTGAAIAAEIREPYDGKLSSTVL